MDMWRGHIAGDLAALRETRDPQVFAHLMAPHVPLLYRDDGSPAKHPCWPCNFMTQVESTDPALGGTLKWLHTHLIEAIDSLLERWPDATIVLFSDHGHRFTDLDDRYQAFLAARTPGHPEFFADDPHIGRVLEVVR